MAAKDIYKLIIDSISAHVAVLDDCGVILETNQAWQSFAATDGLSGPMHCNGKDYLAVCELADNDASAEADNIADRIRQVIDGEQDEYFTQYSCHSPEEIRWFALRVVRIKGGGKARAIVTHEDITPIMATQEKLAETNVALKVLLKQMDKEQQKIGEIVLTNIKELILPDISKLQSARLAAREQFLVENIDKNLRDIVSPFLKQLSLVHKFLTPQEYRVASLVREGQTSKEIADFLGISENAVNFHRKKIRKKLGLTDTGSNLRSHLLSLG